MKSTLKRLSGYNAQDAMCGYIRLVLLQVSPVILHYAISVIRFNGVCN